MHEYAKPSLTKRLPVLRFCFNIFLPYYIRQLVIPLCNQYTKLCMKVLRLPLFVKEVYQRSDDDSSLNNSLRKNENEFEYDSEMKYFM